MTHWLYRNAVKHFSDGAVATFPKCIRKGSLKKTKKKTQTLKLKKKNVAIRHPFACNLEVYRGKDTILKTKHSH